MNSTRKDEMKSQLEENSCEDLLPAVLHIPSGCDQISLETGDVFCSVLKIRNHIREAESESKKLRLRGLLWSEGLGEYGTDFRASISKTELQLREQGKLFKDFYGRLFKSTGCKDSPTLGEFSTESFIPKSNVDAIGLEGFSLEKLAESSEKSLLKNFLSCLDEKNRKLMDSNRDHIQGAIYENIGNGHHHGDPHSCEACSAYLLKIHQLEGEKRKLRETTLALRKEGKQLKSDNIELLDQLKGLHNTLELKENELRDFIMNFGIRVKESEMAMKSLRSENERLKKELLIAKEEKSQSEKPHNGNETISCELGCVARNWPNHVDASGRTGKTKEKGSFSESQLVPPACKNEVNQPPHSPKAPASTKEGMASSAGACSGGLAEGEGTVKEQRPIRKIDFSHEVERHELEDRNKVEPPQSSGSSSSASESQYLSLANPDSGNPRLCSTPTSNQDKSVDEPDCEEQDNVFFRSCSAHDLVPINGNLSSGRTRRKTLSKTFSKIFGKDKRFVESPCSHPSEEGDFVRSAQTSMEVKCQRWDVIKGTSFSSWTAKDVMIWLELECCLPTERLVRCQDNIKDGHILLKLNDLELAEVLGLSNPLHKLKVRLALDERRDLTRPNSHLLQLDHCWVARTWLRDLGLTQYSSIFEENLVDGRMLNELAKKDLEKYLHMSKKQHQASFFYGVDLLRMLNFDKEAIYMRRANCMGNDIDVLVWSNERVSTWIKSINLSKYADNLHGSGIHGALMTLDSTFNVETMAQGLNLPPGNTALHNQLKIQLDRLLAAARQNISPGLVNKISNKNRFRRTFSFRSSGESASYHGSGSFKLHRKAPMRNSTNSLPASSRQHRNRPFSDAMISVTDTDEGIPG